MTVELVPKVEGISDLGRFDADRAASLCGCRGPTSARSEDSAGCQEPPLDSAIVSVERVLSVVQPPYKCRPKPPIEFLSRCRDKQQRRGSLFVFLRQTSPPSFLWRLKERTAHSLVGGQPLAQTGLMEAGGHQTRLELRRAAYSR